jgi:glycosyltransferase involved in cell wall biosynthesis
MALRHKVYFIACCFPPFGRGNAITNSCVANSLSEKFDVDVVCMQREEGGLIAYQEDRSLVEGLHPHLGVHRVRASNWRGLNIALYALGILPCYFLNWAWSVWRQRDTIFSQAGVVFAVYPVFSDLVVAYFVSRRYGFPLLVDFRDDFAGVMSSGWRSILRPFYRYMEKRIIAAADRVSVTTEALRQDLLDRYGLEPDKVEVVYNIVPTNKDLVRTVGDSSLDVLRIVYAGAMSRVQKPEVLLKAYAHLAAEDPLWIERLQAELYGPESPYFSVKIRKWLAPGCEFGGFKPQTEVAQLVATADIGFFSLADSTYAYATPTKLFDYIEAGVPIVASLPQGAAREIVERSEIGLVADAGDAIGLAKCLRRMVEDEELRRTCRANMGLIRDRFSPRVQIAKWGEMLIGMGVEPLLEKEKEDQDEGRWAVETSN